MKNRKTFLKNMNSIGHDSMIYNIYEKDVKIQYQTFAVCAYDKNTSYAYIALSSEFNTEPI